MHKIVSAIFILILIALEIACSAPETLAPVEELHWRSKNTNQYQHIVRSGDTLYSIAFRYDKDYRLLADYNHLRSPYTLRIGQIIYLRYLEKRPKTHVNMPKPSSPKPRMIRSSTSPWVRPAKGRIITGFAPSIGKKGIDIAGKKGDFVYASANGVVAYAGSGLSGYGNLIIIKHAGQFLSAYGNNFRNRVREGQKVKAGEIIAEMGIVDRKFWGVHFEIRKSGQPVNPMHYF